MKKATREEEFCKGCDQPMLPRGRKRKDPSDYRHASGCPLDDSRDEELRRWAKAWGQLPPLVRASVAYSVMRDARDRSGSYAEKMQTATALGLDRRAAVDGRFAQAYLAVAEMMTALVTQADAEAVARGIDADTEGVTTVELAV